MEKTIYSKNQAELTAILVQMRKHAQLTQIQLAQKLKREQNFVARIELGERRLDVIEFWEYCRVCGADPLDVAGRVFGTFKSAKA